MKTPRGKLIGPGEGDSRRIDAIQEGFGRQFLWNPRRCHAEQIIAFEFRNIVSDPLGDNGRSVIHCRVKRQVDPTIVRASLQDLGQAHMKLEPGGFWYEVHDD